MYGYASSPIAFRDTVIVPVGGQGKALMAFQQADGSVAWAKNDFGNVYSSPLLIDVGGLEQLVVLMDGAVLAVNPHNGDLQWQVPFKADYSIAVSTPVWGAGQSAVRLLRVQRRHEGHRAASATVSRRRRPSCGAPTACGCITATRCGSATRSTSRAAGRAARPS